MKTILKTTLLLFVINVSVLQAQTDDALKINDNGNVGINTSNPTEKLEVNGNTKVNGNVTATNVTTDSNVNANGKIQQNGNDLLPKGAIIMWYGGTTAPAGWAICNGENGTPDLRGRFIVGVGTNPKIKNGQDYVFKDSGGDEKVTLTVEQMPKHKHGLKYSGNTGEEAKKFKNEQGWSENGFKAVYSTDRDGGTGSDAVSEEGKSEPFDNRPPFFALYYIMKL